MAGPTVVSASEPNMEIVHKLEELLAAAMSGELRAFGSVTVARGGLVTTGWCGSEEGHLHQLISGASFLHHRIVRHSVG